MSSEEKAIKQALNFVAELDLLKEQWYEADKPLGFHYDKRMQIEQKILDLVLDKKRK
jgi:hypothetical protein